jgi:hypothetical protein
MRPFLTIFAIALGGCAASTMPAIDPLPLNYRELARDHVQDHFSNAHAIRSAQISAPKSTAGSALAEAGQPDYWAVCLRVTDKADKRAKSKDTVLLIRQNQVMDARDDAPSTSFCRGAEFEPFHEVQRGA